jgi:hypothetical protein
VDVTAGTGREGAEELSALSTLAPGAIPKGWAVPRQATSSGQSVGTSRPLQARPGPGQQAVSLFVSHGSLHLCRPRREKRTGQGWLVGLFLFLGLVTVDVRALSD